MQVQENTIGAYMREMKAIAMSTIRKERGMKRSELARKAGMQAGMISWIETGRFVPYESQIEKIAKALGVDDPGVLLEEVSA